MTLEELRRKAKRDFRKPSEKLFWMHQVNKLLEFMPDFFGPAIHGPITPEDIGLHLANRYVGSRYNFPKCHSQKMRRWRQTFAV